VSDEVRAERMEQSQLIADLTAELAGKSPFFFVDSLLSLFVLNLLLKVVYFWGSFYS
jgi:hypothetical protein